MRLKVLSQRCCQLDCTADPAFLARTTARGDTSTPRKHCCDSGAYPAGRNDLCLKLVTFVKLTDARKVLRFKASVAPDARNGN